TSACGQARCASSRTRRRSASVRQPDRQMAARVGLNWWRTARICRSVASLRLSGPKLRRRPSEVSAMVFVPPPSIARIMPANITGLGWQRQVEAEGRALADSALDFDRAVVIADQ